MQGCHFTWKNLEFDDISKKKNLKVLEFEKFQIKPGIQNKKFFKTWKF